jgi:hypothetical protein
VVEWSRARESAAEWRMVAEGSLEPGKREKATNSQSGRCKAEEEMGGDSSEDILRRGEACTLLAPGSGRRIQRGVCYNVLLCVLFLEKSCRFVYPPTLPTPQGTPHMCSIIARVSV